MPSRPELVLITGGKKKRKDMKLLTTLAIATVAFFAPAVHLLLLAFVLVGVDTVLGTLAARKRGEAITSTGMKAGIFKLLKYELVILLAFMAQGMMFGAAAVPLLSIVSTWVAANELLSCVENLNTLSGGTLFKSLLSKLGQKQ
jgi:hypothetical protein